MNKVTFDISKLPRELLEKMHREIEAKKAAGNAGSKKGA